MFHHSDTENLKVKGKSKQVSKSFAVFCAPFRVHALACSRQQSAAGKQTKVWTLNFSKHLVTFAHLLNKVKKRKSFLLLPFAFYILQLCGLFVFSATAQDLPDKIRGYKVYDAKISVKTESDKTEIKGVTEAFVKIGEPEIADISLTGVTLEISAEVSGLEQSGRVDFLTFHDFRVNDLPVKVEEYKESFSFNKNQTVILPKPARIFLETSQVLRGALKERKESNEEWRVTGKVFVFGKFKKFGFSFKRVVPIEINIKIKNPLKNSTS